MAQSVDMSGRSPDVFVAAAASAAAGETISDYIRHLHFAVLLAALRLQVAESPGATLVVVVVGTAFAAASAVAAAEVEWGTEHVADIEGVASD